jgi:hypothetical protein
LMIACFVFFRSDFFSVAAVAGRPNVRCISRHHNELRIEFFLVAIALFVACISNEVEHEFRSQIFLQMHMYV